MNKNTWIPLCEQPVLFPPVEAERLQRQGEQKFRTPHFTRAPAGRLFSLLCEDFRLNFPGQALQMEMDVKAGQ